MNLDFKLALDPELTYLNHAAIGVMTQETANSYSNSFNNLAKWSEYALDLEALNEDWNNVRNQFATLINGHTSGVTITFNTASGLHIVADGINHLYSSGKNIIITELEFTTNSYVWQKICKRHDMELRVAKFENNLSHLITLIDDQTVLVSISSVQFSNGFRADIGKITKIAHEYGAYVAVDAIQSLGIIPTDIKNSDIDFIAAGSYKWLGGPLGTGLFHMKSELIEEIDSVLVGWFGDKKFHRQTHHKFEPWDDAREYQSYISPYFTSIKNALIFMNELDQYQTLKHVIGLQDKIIQDLENSKYHLDTITETKHRSGIIKFNHEESEKIVEKLKSEKIIVSLRDGGIRISPHYHNSMEDIDRLTTKLIELG